MDMNSEIISLETFQKMWNGEACIEHNQMVDALDDKSVWEFVLDETTNGSTKVFEFFTEAEMPSRSALIQLMNTVPNELFGSYHHLPSMSIGFKVFYSFSPFRFR